MEAAQAAMATTCQRCGHELLLDATFCSQCGEQVAGAPGAGGGTEEYEEVSNRSRLVALLLCVFLGYLGIHRFYVGKIWTGILWLFTGGLFGIGYIIDLIMIAAGGFRDIDGLRLIFWDPAE